MYRRILPFAGVFLVVLLTGCGDAVAAAPAATAATESTAPDVAMTGRALLVEQASALTSFVDADIATRFLNSVSSLPAIKPRVVYRNRDTRDAISEAEAAAREPSALTGYERMDVDEQLYYFTRYGSPLAFVRPLDLLGAAGLDDLHDTTIADFGFGTVGHLRLLAECGATVHGIDVDPLLGVLYDRPTDTGPVGKGQVSLHIGRFPADDGIARALGSGPRFDAFISKNTLKNGYIHPAEPVDSRMLVDLGVDDATFVRAVHSLLLRGGYFMIYNLSPAQSNERYLPWADGRSPFSRELLQTSGFEIIAFDVDDTDAAREMGRHLGWAESMDLSTDLFGTYTLARKR